MPALVGSHDFKAVGVVGNSAAFRAGAKGCVQQLTAKSHKLIKVHVDGRGLRTPGPVQRIIERILTTVARLD